MTTAELGLVTTAIVGVAASLGPLLTAWANRAHERSMARSTRLYDQRRTTYQDLGVFLERARLRLYRTVPLLQPEPDAPVLPSDEEWTDLQARAAINGSGEVQAKFATYREAETAFYGTSSTLTAMHAADPDYDEIPGLRQAADEYKMAAYAALDAVEQAMRDELVRL